MTELPWNDEDRFGSARPEAIGDDAALESLEREIARGIEIEAARGNRAVNPSAKFDDIKAEYVALFGGAEITAERLGSATEKFSVLWFADQIRQNRARYEEITRRTEVPWFAIGILHALECSFSFARHLFNGDPLTDFTKRFPPGEPRGIGNPPFSFDDAAVAALQHEGFDNQADWSLARTLHRFERYNGMSYRTRLRMASPYLWSFTDLYDKGKFKEIPKPGGGFQSVFDPELRSKQCGAGAMLRALANTGAATFPEV
jgi:lysozyme family protein